MPASLALWCFVQWILRMLKLSRLQPEIMCLVKNIQTLFDLNEEDIVVSGSTPSEPIINRLDIDRVVAEVGKILEEKTLYSSSINFNKPSNQGVRELRYNSVKLTALNFSILIDDNKPSDSPWFDLSFNTSSKMKADANVLNRINERRKGEVELVMEDATKTARGRTNVSDKIKPSDSTKFQEQPREMGTITAVNKGDSDKINKSASESRTQFLGLKATTKSIASNDKRSAEYNLKVSSDLFATACGREVFRGDQFSPYGVADRLLTLS